MEFLEQSILQFLKKKGNVDLKELKREFEIVAYEQFTLVEKSLKNLEVKGEIYQDKEGRYTLLINKPLIMQGRVHFKENGDACVCTKDNKSITIPKEKANGIFHKDIVTVKNIYQDNKDHLFGTIDKVIKREHEQVSCEVTFKNGKNTLIPYNSKSKIPLNVDQRILDKHGVGELLLVNLCDNNTPYDGVIVKSIGHKDEPDMDEKAIAYNYGFDCEYSSKYLKELEKLPTYVDSEKELKSSKRVDLRDKKFFTIDGENTKDIDDAICIEVLPNGNYKLYVSIAHVSHYVKDGTVICNEAYKKATSVYMNNTVIHMLHPKISNGICSLHPNVDRLTRTCEMIITPNGKIVDYDIYDSIINSKKKMTYEEVNQILENDANINGYEDFYDDLKLMSKLSSVLEVKKNSRGYLNFSREEILAKGRGNNISFIKKTQGTAEKLIENFMLAANETVAEFIYYRGLPFIYRVHEAPDEEKTENFIKLLNNIGYEFKTCKSITSNSYIQNLVNKILSGDNTIEKNVLTELLLINTMKRAKYSNVNTGHYGLALKNYTHFTSPIRRYADLQVHKLLDLYLKCDTLYQGDLDDYLKEIANQCTKKSMDADKAEIEARKMRMAEYMEKRIGQEFNCTVIKVEQAGLTVQTEEGITGTINFYDLNDDNYIYDEKTQSVKGANTGTIYKIGSPVTLKVKEASKKNQTVIFEKNNIKEKNKTKKKSKKRVH